MLSNLTIWFYIDSVPFDADTVHGKTSLGGSESAAIGLASALARRGHDVHILATKVTAPIGPEGLHVNGVQWHSAEHEFVDLMNWYTPDVFVSLRMPQPFIANYVPARLNLLWAQDMLIELAHVAHALAQVDAVVYVSEFHREQWREKDPAIFDRMPSFVTRNAFDPTLVAESRNRCGNRKPMQFAHISRPERGLKPLLKMWPAIRQVLPDATLKICRYSSMYDAQGWGRVVAAFDEDIAAVNAQVGGIELLGELSKLQVYDLLHESTAMLYPGVTEFAETSCIAAIEAQACGCPFVGSYRGALPETVSEFAGCLIDGDAMSEHYQREFVDEVVSIVNMPSPDYDAISAAGRAHVNPAYTFDAVAGQWTDWLRATFEERAQRQAIPVLRQLLHWDDHGPARVLARRIIDAAIASGTYVPATGELRDCSPDVLEAIDAEALCNRVMAGEEQKADDYAERAIDVEVEMSYPGTRLDIMSGKVAEWAPSRVLDFACGNGSFVFLLAEKLKSARIDGVDYSPLIPKNVQKAEDWNLSDRVSFTRGGLDVCGTGYDVVFCGEFIEHVEKPWEWCDDLERRARPGGRVLITMPIGPWSEDLPPTTPYLRGHCHAFKARDVATMLGDKVDLSIEHMSVGVSQRGEPLGHWVISWEATDEANRRPAKALDYDHTIATTRPYQRIVATMIVKNEQDWIAKCLSSIWPIVDDIVLLDTGSDDQTVAIADQLFNRHQRKIHVHRYQWDDHFAHARNESLRLARDVYRADWIFWIDADEHLSDPRSMRRWVGGQGPYLGYIVKQNHLMLDADPFFDVPARLFRARDSKETVQFYGMIHEQPETGRDKGIFPCIDAGNCNIVHYGYETYGIRIAKMTRRNIILLKRELKDPNERRELSHVLFIRELTTLAGMEGAATNNPTPKAIEYLSAAVRIYHEQGLNKRSHRLHSIVWPFYQLALKQLRRGVQFDYGCAAWPNNGDPGARVKPQRWYALTLDEMRDQIAQHAAEVAKQVGPPEFKVTPWSNARPADLTIGEVTSWSADSKTTTPEPDQTVTLPE